MVVKFSKGEKPEDEGGNPAGALTRNEVALMELYLAYQRVESFPSKLTGLVENEDLRKKSKGLQVDREGPHHIERREIIEARVDLVGKVEGGWHQVVPLKEVVLRVTPLPS